MKDFIGQTITVGAFVASGGKGNTRSEYGMILHRVAAVTPKLKLTRLKASYYPKELAEATSRTTTHKKSTNIVVVTPPQEVIDLFERVADGTQQKGDADKVGTWLHGRYEVF